jgi:hypothetical protein
MDCSLCRRWEGGNGSRIHMNNTAIAEEMQAPLLRHRRHCCTTCAACTAVGGLSRGRSIVACILTKHIVQYDRCFSNFIIPSPAALLKRDEPKGE